MSLLSVQSLQFEHHSGTPLFGGVTFGVQARDKIALAGPNGCGKTTLLRILAGEVEASAGRVVRRRGLRVVRFSQTQDAAARSRVIDGFDGAAEHEALRALSRAGLDGECAEAQVAELSEGQRVRVRLARCLAQEADLYLLDEPTNHLDIAGLEEVERWIAELDAAVIVVSHDRELLCRTTTRTLVFERGRLMDYAGNYEEYRGWRAADERRRWTEYEESRRAAAALERAQQRRSGLADRTARAPVGARSSHDFYRAKAARIARTARILRERKSALLEAEKPWEEQGIPALDFGAVEECGPTALDVRGVAKSFSGRAVLDGVRFAVRRGERWAITGPNGCGKSTLLRILVGDLAPDSGEVVPGGRVRAAWFAQEGANLPMLGTALELCRERGASETSARTMLGCLKLGAEFVARPLASLSAGERAKAALASVLVSGANLLLLDEPANHLELEAREALEEALRRFPGTVVFVSHDRYFVRSLATHSVEL